MAQNLINSIVFSVGGGKRGEITRRMTMTLTDKRLAVLIPMVPLSLLIFSGIFSPRIFDRSSIACIPFEHHDLHSRNNVTNMIGWIKYCNSFCWECGEMGTKVGKSVKISEL